MTPERASELCLSCGECCKGVVAFFPRPPYLGEGRAIEWMKARGMRILDSSMALWRVWIPSRCPHLLDDNRCDIYETRPAVCRDYDGRLSEHLDCLWKAEV